MRVFFIFILFYLVFLVSGEAGHEITKRSFYLLFPRNTILQFTYGVTVPFVLPRRSINLSWCYQAQYNLPYNISNFVPKIIAVRSNPLSFDLSRIKFYEYFGKMLDNFGLYGEECVLRSVCEIAEIPMDQHRADSVLEKIVHFLFTPSLELNLNDTNKSIPNDNEEDSYSLTKKLLHAEQRGKSKGNCDVKYSNCIMSIVDLMTVLYVT